MFGPEELDRLAAACGSRVDASSAREVCDRLTEILYDYLDANDHASGMAPITKVRQALQVIVGATDKIKKASSAAPGDAVPHAVRRRMAMEFPGSRAEGWRMMNCVFNATEMLGLAAKAALQLKSETPRKRGRPGDGGLEKLISRVAAIGRRYWGLRSSVYANDNTQSHLVSFILAYLCIAKEKLGPEVAADARVRRDLSVSASKVRDRLRASKRVARKGRKSPRREN